MLNLAPFGTSPMGSLSWVQQGGRKPPRKRHLTLVFIGSNEFSTGIP